MIRVAYMHVFIVKNSCFSVSPYPGMIPLWIFTLGQYVIDDHTQVMIPFQNIFISLASMLVPVVVGVLIQKNWKRGAKFILRFIRPFYIFLILCMFSVGVWSNLYIFRLITPSLIAAACILPYTGFLVGGLVAFVCRQPPARVLAIAIETGIQNTGLPIILMKFSLPQPEADLSIASPVVLAMFMPLPFWIAILFIEARKRWRIAHSGGRHGVTTTQEHKADCSPEAADTGAAIGSGELLLTTHDAVGYKFACPKSASTVRIDDDDALTSTRFVDDFTCNNETTRGN